MFDSILNALPPRLRSIVASLGPTQTAALGGVCLLVVLLMIGTTYWVNRSHWALLATDMDPASMAGVVEKLKTAKVDYLLDPGGRSLRVAADRVDELRMQLAAEGLPSSGRIGFELFDQAMFGATEMTEKVNYQRALEGELERTIGSLSNVASARVHLVLPRESLFMDSDQPAKASVVLRLKSSRPMPAADVQGIAGLVASSVDGLRTEAVTILDSEGQRISRTVGDEVDGVRFDRQQQVEHDLANRLVALLEPVVGIGRVRANVSATLSAESQNETEEVWDPNTVVRSRQTSFEADGRSTISGVAGSRGNLPPDPASPTPTPQPTATAAGGNNRTSEVTNYEISKVTRQRVTPPGQLARLTVAVLVDDARIATVNADGEEEITTAPRSPDDLQQLQQLVASAVGFDAARGDQITVENIAFERVSLDAPPLPAAPVSVWQQVREFSTENWKLLLQYGLMALLVLGVLLWVARPLIRRLSPVVPAPRLPAPATSVAAVPGGATSDAIPDTRVNRSAIAARQVARLAMNEPEQLARIVRGWLAEEERDR